MTRLTDHQKALLIEVRKGKEYKAIAKERGVSPRTIEITMSRIIKAMDAKNKLEAIRHAELAGEIEKEGVWTPPEGTYDN